MNRLKADDNFNDNNKMKRCEACDYPAPVKSYSGYTTGKKWLCELCASTVVGNKVSGPAEANDFVLFTICFVGNAILDQLGAFNKGNLQLEKDLREED